MGIDTWTEALNDEAARTETSEPVLSAPSFSTSHGPNHSLKLHFLSGRVVKSVACSSSHCLVLTSDGDVYSFGSGQNILSVHAVPPRLSDPSQALKAS
jgi:alpha-tubulin suppressor-like RCC1 family protein